MEFIYQAEVVSVLHSPTFLPQKQSDPSGLRSGFLLAQVPLNSPPLIKIKRTEIKTKNIPTSAIASKTVAMMLYFG